jgi:hypothetical protein
MPQCRVLRIVEKVTRRCKLSELSRHIRRGRCPRLTRIATFPVAILGRYKRSTTRTDEMQPARIISAGRIRCLLNVTRCHIHGSQLFIIARSFYFGSSHRFPTALNRKINSQFAQTSKSRRGELLRGGVLERLRTRCAQFESCSAGVVQCASCLVL